MEKTEKPIMMDLTLFDVETSINFQLILRVYQRSVFWMQEQLIIFPTPTTFSLHSIHRSLQ